MEKERISDSKLVTLRYQLFVKNDDGSLELMEETTEKEPLRFLCGTGMMLQKFEENLLGLAAGDKFKFTLTPDEAYGEYEEGNQVDLPRNIFEDEEGKINTEYIYAGAIVPLVDAEGNRINAEVVEIKPEAIRVDFNHPLAGEELTFEGEIIEVRMPTADDLKAMSHSCGCCQCDCDDDNCGCGCGCEH